jgi:hypothetical protein
MSDDHFTSSEEWPEKLIYTLAASTSFVILGEFQEVFSQEPIRFDQRVTF